MASDVGILDTFDFTQEGKQCRLILKREELICEIHQDEFPTKGNILQRSFSRSSDSGEKKGSAQSGVTLLKVQDKNLDQLFDETTGKKIITQRIKLKEVIGVKTAGLKEASKQKTSKSSEVASPHQHQSPNFLNILVVRRCKKHRWRTRKVSFFSEDSNLVKTWADQITEILKSPEFGRPKSVIVFINPVGGKRKAPEIFQHKVAPYFDMAGLHYDVIMTERANHARDYILDCDLSKTDGLISVGGDGMFTEILHGLMARTYKEAGLNQPKAGADLLRPSMKLGIIPAGSTDTVIWSLQGCNDPSTSALHIAIGDKFSMDIAALHAGEEFIKYNVSLLGYGYYGDLLVDSEMNRWMGPRRYDWAGLKKFIGRKVYEGEFFYIPSDHPTSHPRDQNVCKIDCSVCSEVSKEINLEQRSQSALSSTHPDEEWKSIKGRFIAINAFLISCRCRFSENGPSPNAHLGDGCIDVVLIQECSRANYFKHLYRCTKPALDQFDLPGVNVLRLKAFRFEPSMDVAMATADMESQQSLKGNSLTKRRHSTWNCDGEIVEQPGIEVRAHAQVLQMFARGVEEEIFYDSGSASCLQGEKD